MSNYPAMSESEFRNLTTESEWSDAANAAFNVLDRLMEFKNALRFLTREDILAHTSFAISWRWRNLNDHMRNILEPAERYSRALAESIEAELKEKAVPLDEINLEFEPIEREYHIDCLAEAMTEYAEVIVQALMKEMGAREAEDFENNR